MLVMFDVTVPVERKHAGRRPGSAHGSDPGAIWHQRMKRSAKSASCAMRSRSKLLYAVRCESACKKDPVDRDASTTKPNGENGDDRYEEKQNEALASLASQGWCCGQWRTRGPSRRWRCGGGIF